MQSHKPNARAESAAPTELNPLLSVFTQGFISGFALIAPWALQECRAYGLIMRLDFDTVALRLYVLMPVYIQGLESIIS